MKKQKAAEAEAVLKFFEEKVIATARPARQCGGMGVGTTIREALEAAEKQIGERFAGRPLVEASIRYTLGQNFIFLGEAKSAVRQLERSRDLRLSEFGENHLDTLLSMHELGTSYHCAGREDEALALRERVLLLCRKVLGNKHPRTLSAMHALAVSYSDTTRRNEALTLRQQVLELRLEVLGPEHPDTLGATNKKHQRAKKRVIPIPLHTVPDSQLERARFQALNQSERARMKLG